MVKGIEIFEKYFEAFSNEYVLIGGTACDLLMGEAGIDFRATKDLDIVLIVEALTAGFGKKFWEFINNGKYQIREKSNGKPELYRFLKPEISGYPAMIELFSRSQKDIFGDINIIPIHINNYVSSLSAILLNEDYYKFLIDGRVFINGLPVLSEIHLIPFKAKAWLDLTLNKENGYSVDSRDINKHKNDIFRLSMLINQTQKIILHESIKNDMQKFIDRMKYENIDLRAFGIKNQTKDDILALFAKIYLS